MEGIKILGDSHNFFIKLLKGDSVKRRRTLCGNPPQVVVCKGKQINWDSLLFFVIKILKGRLRTLCLKPPPQVAVWKGYNLINK